MKKLLSICFLSILLGLLSFSTQAQSNNCRSGFWIENLQPETLTGIANAPSGNGTLVLDNVLNPAVKGQTDLYELHFCPCGLDPKTKVSVDWLLYRDGQLVNENLSAYADFSIYTLYPELNVQGQCQQIAWLGGQVANNFGFCNEQEAANNALIALQNNINGVGPCTTPTNYPGALQSQYGTQPGSVVVNQITGETTSAMGLATLYSQAFDFFYMDFFTQTRTIVKITWKQVGNYSLVMRVRERVGGTDWNNAYWKKNADGTLSQVDYIGGHQSCCGPVLAEDSIHYLVTGEFFKEVCENEPYQFGTIEDRCNQEVIDHWFTTTTPDTFVMFGNYDSVRCCHITVDSVYRFHFYQRNTPDVNVHDSIICQCTPLTSDDIVNMVGVDQVDLEYTFNHYLQWYGYGDAATVEIGTGTGTTNYLPAYLWYHNAYTQQIYTPEEVGGAGHLSSISFYHATSSASPVTETLKIYLSNTDKSSFSSSSDWDLNEKTLVYEGTVTFSEEGWVEFPFVQTGFDYDGVSNLLVTVIGHNTTYANYHSFAQSNTPNGAYMAAYKYRDPNPEYTNENVATEAGTENTVSYRNDVRFGVRQLTWLDAPEAMPTDVEAASYEYTVRQVNEYANYAVLDGSVMDTITCVGEPYSFNIIIEPMIVELPEDPQICVADFTDTTVHTVIAERVDNCSTITRWFAADEDGEADLSEVIFEGDTFNMTKEFLSEYFNFEANKDGQVVFFAAAYNANLNCTGKILNPYVITFHQSPVLTATVTPDSLLCPGGEAQMQVTITNNPFQLEKPFTYYWTGVDSLTDMIPEYSTYFLTIPEDNSHDANSTQYLPDYVLFDYSYTQQLFTAEELASGPISKIGFYAASVNNSPVSQNRKLSIYLSTTDKDNLASGWEIDEDNMTLVFNDWFTYTADAWNDFVLTTPFDYDPSQGNLVITIIDSTGDWSSSNYFYRTSTDQNAIMARYAYRDGTPYDVIPGESGNTATYRDNIRFEFTGVTMVEGVAPIMIGEDFVLEGNGTSNRVPVNNYYKNSYNQQIYTPDEISHGMPGVITSLAFDYAYDAPTTVKNDVDIYLTTTDKEFFANVTDTISIAGLQPVYSGALNCSEGWNTFELITPYEYDGVSNLALIVYDHSGNYNGYSHVFRTVAENSVAKSLCWYSDSRSTIEDLGSSNNTGRYIYNFRSNITFTMMVPYAPAIDLKYSKGYKDLTSACHEAYESTVFVVDDNRCKSNVVTFNYETGDTIAPVVVPASYTEIFNTCDSAVLAEFAEEFEFASIDALDNYLKNVEEADSTFGAYDNCSLVAVSFEDTFVPAGEGCEISIIRTYTLMDSCHNVSTFTHTFIGHDQNAPDFAIDRPMRLIPVPSGADCKYNAPSLATMKAMIDPFVIDDCTTDHAYLMDSLQFFWENTTINPADAQNIFEVENHLTISAITRDLCGNWTDTTVIFFLDRPDTLYIVENQIAPISLCYGESSAVAFRPANIYFDENVGAITPLTYTWSEKNGRAVSFSDTTGTIGNQALLTSDVNFLDGAGDYYIILTVTDANGCSAVSAEREFHVRAELNVAIEPDVRNGAVEPYCPTYGNLTVKAITTGEPGLQVMSYEWIGESVNEASEVDTTWITIIPEWCDTIYTATVNIVDDHNCEATATRSFSAVAKGPAFIQPLEDVTVHISDSCKLLVPDFQNLITNEVIFDSCYGFSEIIAHEGWYSQVPAKNTVFTADSQLVTITITNPCGKATSTSLYVRKPATYPSVSIDPESIAACYEDIMNPANDYELTATGLYLGNNPSYVWTVGNDTVGLNNEIAFPIDPEVWAPMNEEITYNFTITATNNENGCVASATAPVLVHYQGDPVHLRVWDNTMCVNGHFNGVIAVDTIPFNYVVTLVGMDVPYGPVVKISDVPYHYVTEWNTIIFDSLQEGRYLVTVENLFGCEMYADTVVNYQGLQFDTTTYVATPMSACSGNATITITPEYGFSYELYDANVDLIGSGLTYNNLVSGPYWIKKIQASTNCPGWTYVYIPDVTVPEVFAVDTTPLTNCTSNNGSIMATSTVSNMQYRLMKRNANGSYSVFKPTTATAAYTHDGYKYQASGTFSNLEAGNYLVVAYNPSTGCTGVDTAIVRDARVLPTIEVALTPNHYCSNTANTYDGTVTVTPASEYQLTMKWKASGSNYNNNQAATSAGVYANLYPGEKRQYQLVAKNTTTNCSTTVSNIRIENDLYYPSVTVDSIISNTVCDTEFNPYNGGAILNVTANIEGHVGVEYDSCDYTVNMHDSYGDGWNGNTLTFEQNGEVLYNLTFSTGSTKSASIRLASNAATEITYGGGRWKYENSFEILDASGNIVWSKESYDDLIENTDYSYDSYTFTPSCGEPVEAYPTFLTYVKPYTVSVDGANQGSFTDTLATVTGYKEGSHNYTVTSNYKCSVSGSFTVTKENIPEMILSSTPDHFCAPTFEKPGDGTVIIESPIADATHEYTYKFFDANDNEMTVPYDLPMTHTKYWLAHGTYRVVAVEVNTGCTVQDTKTVAWEPYTVTFDTTTTPDEFCTATLGNGTITVINAQVSNPDIVGNFVYSIDGGTTYQTSNVFTGLNADPDNPYYVTVKELTTACVADSKVVIINNDECAPIIDSIYDNFGRGTEFHYCFGTEGMYLNGAAHDACDNTPLEYYWSAPCADPTSSNTSSIAVQTDHYVVGGCYYTLTVRNPQTECTTSSRVTVFVHPLPDLYVMINDDTAKTTHYNVYCEDEPLALTVYNRNQEALDIESIQWTQGYTATGVQTINVIGTDYEDDLVTFCVRANNVFDCGSAVISIPVKFNRIITNNVVMTRCDGNCFITEPNGQITEITKPAGQDYPYSTTVTRTYENPVTGCDSIVNYQITLYGAPELAMDRITPEAFCEDEQKTLADFTPAATSIDWNGLEGTGAWMAAETGYTYTKVTSAADLTAGEYVITNAAGTKAMSSVRATSSYYYPGENFNADNVTASNITWNLTVNEDGTYSLSNDYGYLYITSNTGEARINTTMAPATKFTATFTNDGVKFVNDYHTNYALKYNHNNNANRFAGYGKNNTSNMDELAFYKKTINNTEVPATTVVDYEFVTTHNVKYVVTNNCGSDEATASFDVYKKPAINSFVAGNGHCASEMYAFTANVSSYGTQGTAELYIQGNTTPIATKTFNGLNQAITFPAVVLPHSYNGKTITLKVKNSNNYCDVVTLDSILVVDTSYINNLANSHVYCVGQQMKISDFTGFVPANYNSYSLKLMNGTAPAANDGTITLPYTFANRAMNGKKVYIIASNDCYNNIVSNAVTLRVDSMPYVADIANIDVCSADFELNVPEINTKGSAIIEGGQGWLLQNANGVYQASSVDAIKAAAADHVVNAAYYATNSCGSDTTKFTVLVNDKPVVTAFSIATMCPNEKVKGNYTATANFHNINGGDDNQYSFVGKAEGVREPVTITDNLLIQDLSAYTTLWYIVENSCGKDSAFVTINVLTNTHTAPTFHEACAGEPLSAFKATNPSFTGTAGVASEKWQVKINNTIADATLNTEIPATGNPQVRYMWVTNCNDTIYTNFETLTVNQKPVLTLNNVAGVCDGSTIDPATAISSINYRGYADKYDTVYTVGGVEVDAETEYTFADNNKYLVVTLVDNNEACGNVVDSVKLTIYPIPTPTITGPARACSNTDVEFEATAGYQSYVFTINGVAQQSQASNTITYHVMADGVERTYASVTVYDGHCYGSSQTPAEVVVTNDVRFRFFNEDGTENEEHAYTVNDGGGLNYGWEIGTDCGAEDVLVYVEYDIYYNDQIIANNAVGEYFYTSTYTGLDFITYPYVNTNTVTWLNADHSQHDPMTSLHNCSVANPLNPQTRNHFPNYNLGLNAGDVYDDLWMHFIGDRRVGSTLVPFRLNGEYKVVYRLYATDHENDFNHLYYEDNDHMGGIYEGQTHHMGGQNAAMGNITLLVVDSITINVSNVIVSTDPQPETPVIPQAAPELTFDDEVMVAPEMEVWPNPAPAITTTFKARVHHMSGDATVSIVSLTGKQIYNGQMNIDNDNYYFEASVNNLAVGTYVMTVRTADAVITKKVIVTR